MKKIPTLFLKNFENNHYLGVSDKVNPGCEWVLNNEGFATIKYDGACCSIIEGKMYRRYVCKNNRDIPVGFIPSDVADSFTGDIVGWLELNIEKNDGISDLYIEGLNNTFGNIENVEDGTYELCGPKINGNHEKLKRHILIKHGDDVIEVKRTFLGIKEYLKTHDIEGIVFYRGNGEMCKIKKRDFGIRRN